MEITVLGPGCRNCDLLASRVKEAADKLGVVSTIKKVEDYDDILAFGVLATPGLAVNGKLVLSGKVPTVSALVEILQAQEVG